MGDAPALVLMVVCATIIVISIIVGSVWIAVDEKVVREIQTDTVFVNVPVTSEAFNMRCYFIEEEEGGAQ